MKNNETQMSQNNDFDGLVAHIQQTQDVLQNNARLVINRHVTAKAWLTGYYIVEYEQKGADRAKYGEQLLKKLAEKLKDKKTFSYRSLNIYRKFYLTYPALNDQIKHFVLSLPSIVQTVSAQFQLSVSQNVGKMQTVSAKLPIATLWLIKKYRQSLNCYSIKCPFRICRYCFLLLTLWSVLSTRRWQFVALINSMCLQRNE